MSRPPLPPEVVRAARRALADPTVDDEGAAAVLDLADSFRDVALQRDLRRALAAFPDGWARAAIEKRGLVDAVNVMYAIVGAYRDAGAHEQATTEALAFFAAFQAEIVDRAHRLIATRDLEQRRRDNTLDRRARLIRRACRWQPRRGGGRP